MKHYFILNPVSGTKKQKQTLVSEIQTAADKLGKECEIYFTKAQGDGRRFIESICRKRQRTEQGPERIRIYCCGGDGTLNEMVNGAYGFENVELGVIPQGTGNDYIRNYGDPKDFLDITNQLLGESRDSDLIKYSAEYQGKVTEGFCANMFNIGFDCNVVDMTDTIKQWPLFSGSMAYLTSVFIVMVKKKETGLIIEYESGHVRDEKVLLCSIANGCFCGGGIKGVPKCILDDGLMDVSVVRGGISRRFFISLFPKYKKGTHLEDDRSKGVVDYRQEKSLAVTSKAESLRLCVDGEISTQKRVEFKVIPKAFRFIVPKGL